MNGEVSALYWALVWIRRIHTPQTFPIRYRIFYDSNVAWTLLHSTLIPQHNCELVLSLRKLWLSLTCDCHIVGIKLKSHSGHFGNDAADSCAALGRTGERHFDISHPNIAANVFQV